jgi:hypothetical protein
MQNSSYFCLLVYIFSLTMVQPCRIITFCFSMTYHVVFFVKGKGKGRLTTDHEGPEGE